MQPARVILLFVVIIITCLTVFPASAQSERSFIRSGENVTTNGTLMADDFFLVVRSFTNYSDGGFEIHKGSPKHDYGVLAEHEKFGRVFADNTYSKEKFILAMQEDGNLCLYRGSVGSAGSTWCSMAFGPLGSYFAVMQNDGNLCVYNGTGPGDNRGGLWCSGTNVPVTWITASRTLTFATGGGAMHLRGIDGGQTGATSYAGDPGTWWAFDQGGVLRWGPNRDRCMTFSSGSPKTISVTACGTSPNQGGWALAGDGTLRNSNAPDECLDFDYSGAWRDGAPSSMTKPR